MPGGIDLKQFGTRTSQIQISGIRQFTDLVSQYPDAISLTLGQPHFGTPLHIREAGQRVIRAGHTGYTPNRGLPALRQAASAYYAPLLDCEYHPDREILVTVGATHALDIALRVLLNPGDEVIIPAPAYPGYHPLVTLAGAKPVFVDTRDTELKLTPEQLLSALTPNTKLVLLASPANPTGAVYSRDELMALGDVLRRTDTYVVSDEIYNELYYEEQPRSISTIPGMRDRTIVIQGLSKSHCMTGWRIGFLMAPHRFVDEMVKVLQYSTTCASSVSQYAAVEALENGRDDAKLMRDAYRVNRESVQATLAELSIPIDPPQGAFYAFPSIEQLGLSSQSFATRLLDEERVAMVPGSAFGTFGEGHVRLSFACDPVTLTKGLHGFEKLVSKLRNGHITS